MTVVLAEVPPPVAVMGMVTGPSGAALVVVIVSVEPETVALTPAGVVPATKVTEGMHPAVTVKRRAELREQVRSRLPELGVAAIVNVD